MTFTRVLTIYALATLKAHKHGFCEGCGQAFKVGEIVSTSSTGRTFHQGCYESLSIGDEDV